VTRMKRLILTLRRFTPLYRRSVGRVVHRLFQLDLIEKTDNFSNVRWLGAPVWQNVLDLWVIQEAIGEIRPSLLIECGTNRGGSALFYANLFDLIGDGRVITIDIERMHELDHPRIEFIEGSSTDRSVVDHVRQAAAGVEGPVMVILDSDHRESHVAAELEAYAPLVTPGSLLHVQDGVIDELMIFRHERPGPLRAIESFLKTHPDFVWEPERSERFLITHHPKGWLRRRDESAASKPVADPGSRSSAPKCT
jgi:cephalosporin hydroxylase